MPDELNLNGIFELIDRIAANPATCGECVHKGTSGCGYSDVHHLARVCKQFNRPKYGYGLKPFQQPPPSTILK